MLSPGKYHELVPRDLPGNLAYRRHVIRRAASDPAFRAALLDACRLDCLYWVNTFVCQFNPRAAGLMKAAPFVTWDYQDDMVLSRDPARPGLLWCLENDEDLVQEKSRDMGASWLALLVFDWLALFHSYQKFLCISHTEDAVDRADDPDSLFWKVRYVHAHLPGWLLRGAEDKKLNFTYPATTSVITGTATTGRAGVGGRATGILLDEFSKQGEDYAILGQTADTSDFRVFTGTHYGVAGAFYDLTRRPDIRKQVIHWTMHPRKNAKLYRWNPDKPGGAGVESLAWDAAAWAVGPAERPHEFPPDYPFVTDGTPTGGPYPGVRSPWYDRQCLRRKNRRDVSMHLDIDPSGATSQFFEALEIQRLVQLHCCPPVWRGDVAFERDTGKNPELVPSPGGPLRLWVRPDGRGRVPARPYGAGADCATGSGATPTCFAFADAATGEKVAEYTNARVNPDDAAGVFVALGNLFADADGNPARLAWELQGPGVKFGARVIELGARNVYYRVDEGVLPGAKKVSDRPGWVPAPNSKRLLLEDYSADLSNGRFLNRSEGALKETLAFSYDPKGGVEHAKAKASENPADGRENHADQVIADALAAKMCRELGAAVREQAAAAAVPVNSMAGRREKWERRRRDLVEA